MNKLRVPVSVLSFAAMFSLSAAMPIVVPKERRAADETAAKELQEYLGKITGEKFSVVFEEKAPEGPAIHLGKTAFVKAAIADIEKYAEEEWTVRMSGDKLLIAGGGWRGTLYGAYHYLEDVCGVRWLTPVAEDVPKVASVPMPEKALRGKPAMPYRDIYVVPEQNGCTFRARNRVQTNSRTYGSGLVWGAWRGVHTLYTVMGDGKEIKRLFKEHPEWFPLIDGKRWLHEEHPDSIAQSQLCLTNPELRKYWIGKMREAIRADRASAEKAGVPAPMYWAVDQNDAFDGFCQCEKCRAFIEREGGATSGLMLDFCNQVAEELEAEAPDAKFSMLAEHVLEKPPKTVKGRHNVTLRLCDTTSNMLYPWTDRDNAVQRNNLLAWRDYVDSIQIWDYQITYAAATVGLPIPTERTFAPDIRMARDAKGEGFFFEHEQPIHADMRDLKIWLEFKLVENPDLDPKALVRDFTDRYYGAAAGALVRRYRKLLGEAADKVHPNLTYYPTLSAHAFITAELVDDFYGLREEALAAVKGDAEKTARVEHAFMSLDRLFLIRANVMKRQLAKTRPAAKLPAVADVLARYVRVFDREVKARGYERSHASVVGRAGAIDKLVKYVENARDLPVPEIFKDVPQDDLFLYPATFSATYYEAMKWVDDPTSPAGRVLTANPGIAAKYPKKNYEVNRYDWPLKWAIWPAANAGTVRGSFAGAAPAEQPRGYHWYKVASDVQLKPDSVISFWPGSLLPLDGAVGDNSEIGQKYDVWVSLKIEGKDMYGDGKATADTVYFFDQAAVIRKTRHQVK